MINIIYQDEHILIVEKPTGMLVESSPREKKKTLINILPKILADLGYNGKIFLCNRIDKETSGIVVIAKTEQSQGFMFNEFKQRKVKKKYFAFIKGYPRKDKGIIKKRIKGIEAITKYRVVSKYKSFYSFVEVFPETGRTNQIRIHFNSIGNPVIGDRKFARGKDFPIKFRRTALHAAEISFRHPITKKIIKFKSPLPEDMKGLKNQITNLNSQKIKKHEPITKY